LRDKDRIGKKKKELSSNQKHNTIITLAIIIIIIHTLRTQQPELPDNKYYPEAT
jgi:hypothetical protein